MDDWVREILRCPMCKGELLDASCGLVCETCQVRFPIVDDIPVLLASDAEPIT